LPLGQSRLLSHSSRVGHTAFLRFTHLFWPLTVVAQRQLGLPPQPWPFGLEEISGVDVRIYHGDADILVPPHHAKHLAERIPRSRLHLYPGEGHLSLDKHFREIVETMIAT
jgi:pimeloyl-ACP methyl ester carboxylesterase